MRHTPDQSALSDKYLSALICLAVILVTIAVYCPVRNNGFIDFDDPQYVTENKDIQAGFTPDAIKWAFTTNQAFNWHPVTWLSHILDCQLFGLKPAGHHLSSLALHVVNTLLLFLVLRQMTGAIWRSAFVAALFALHPLHVESVAWVSERKDVLSTLFWLLTMWFYVRYTRRPGLAAYLPVFFALALGLMTKQMLVTLPFVLLLLDYWPLDRLAGRGKTVFAKNSFARCLLEKVPLMVLSFIASLIVLHVQSGTTLFKSVHEFPIGVRLENVLLAYAEYIIKMFYPLNLGILYPHPETGIPHWQVAAAGLLLLGITIAVFHFSPNRRWLVVGWLWYIGTLVPVIGLVQVGLQAMADRYTYIPLVGLFIVIAWGVFELTEKLKYRNVILAVSAGIVIVWLSALTYRQVSYWKDNITLFGHTLAVTKNNAITHYNLGRLLLSRGDIDQAIYHWSEAMKIRPAPPAVHKDIAALYKQQGNIDQAIYHLRQALVYGPNDAAAQDMLKQLLSIQESRDVNEQAP